MKREYIILLSTGLLIFFLASTKTGRTIVMKAYQTITEAGIKLIQRVEGLRLSVYQDVAGKWTIGYGHLIKPNEPYYPYGSIKTISQEKATELLHSDIQDAANSVRNRVSVPLNESQFNALVSFVFNVGDSQFSKSTLLKKLNASDYIGAANELDRWVYSDGKRYDGLVARREVEKQLFTA